LPNDIPDQIEVDISSLKEIDQSIHFGDLKISDTIKILNPHDEIVAKVVTPREVVEEPKPAAEGATATTPEGGTAPAAGSTAKDAKDETPKKANA
jgi:hypothetical protein